MQPKVKRALDRAIEREGLSPDLGRLLRAVIQTETRGRHTDKDGNIIRGTSGEYGAAQLMPRTAEEVGVTDPTDVNQNVLGAARYLKKVHAPFAEHPDAYALTLAAYNTGIGNVRRAIRRAGGPDSRFGDIQRHIARSTREKYVPNTLRRFERLGGAQQTQDVTVEAPQPAPVDDSLSERDGLDPITQQMDLQSLADEDPAFRRMLDIYLQTRRASAAERPQQAAPEPAPAPAPALELEPEPEPEPDVAAAPQATAGAPSTVDDVFDEIENEEQARRELGTGFFQDTMTQALTLGGMTDPLAAAGAALVTPVDRDRPFSERYKDILQARQAQREQYTEDNPVTSFVAGTAPATALGGWGTSALMRGAGLGARAAGLGSAAAESTLYGAGTSPGAAEGDIGQVLGDAALSGTVGTGVSLATLGLADGARIAGRTALDATGSRMGRIKPRPDGPHLTDRMQDRLGRAMAEMGKVVEDRRQPLNRNNKMFQRFQPSFLPRIPGTRMRGDAPVLGLLAHGLPGMAAGVGLEAARPALGRGMRRLGNNMARAARLRGGPGTGRRPPSGISTDIPGAPGAPMRPGGTAVTQPRQLDRGPITPPPPRARKPAPRVGTEDILSTQPAQRAARQLPPPTPTASGRGGRTLTETELPVPRVGLEDILSTHPAAQRAVPRVGLEDILSTHPAAQRAARQPPTPPPPTASGRGGRPFPEPELPEAAQVPGPSRRADPRITPQERMQLLDEEVADAILEGRPPRPQGNLDETNPGRGQAPRRPQGRRYEEPELPPAVQQEMQNRTEKTLRSRPGLVRGPLDTMSEDVGVTQPDLVPPRRQLPAPAPVQADPTRPDLIPPQRQLPAPPEPTMPGMQPPDPPAARGPSRVFPMGPGARRALPAPQGPLAPQAPQQSASSSYVDNLLSLDAETEAAMRSGTDGLPFEMRLMDQRFRQLMEDTNPGASGTRGARPPLPPLPRARRAAQAPRQEPAPSPQRQPAAAPTPPTTPSVPTSPRIASAFLDAVGGDPTKPAKLSHVLRGSGMEPEAFKAEMKQLHDAGRVELFNTKGRPSATDRQAGIPVRGRMKYNVRWVDTDSLTSARSADAAPSPQARPRVEGEDSLRGAYLGLSGGQLRSRVRLADLQEQSGLSDREFKKKMRDLHMKGKVILYPDDERGRLTAADKQAAVNTGEPNHLVYWLDPSE